MMTPPLREELILSHMPQVKLLAQRLHRRCPQVELDDLISAGTIGLIQAVDRFDPARNLKLKTLAEHRISGALLDYLRLCLSKTWCRAKCLRARGSEGHRHLKGLL
jgi:RNA polymerase sigma factor for flagellar operon FliA